MSKKGIIIKGIGGFYYVKSDDTVYECKPRGIFRKDKFKPLIGDDVLFTLDNNDKGTITDILPRKNFLIRPPISNISQNIIISAVTKPEINYHFINKILVNGEMIGIKSILCFNKVDLAALGDVKEIEDSFKNTNYQIIFTSAYENRGIDQLKEKLKGNINVFSGASGVGKSSLMNKILLSHVAETGKLSSKTSRGKHTTREVELFEIEKGTYIADTPGFSSIEVTLDIESEELMGYFPEFSDYLGQCKFNSCIHHKEPSCAIKEALEAGKISPSRYESYVEILNQIKEYKRY